MNRRWLMRLLQSQGPRRELRGTPDGEEQGSLSPILSVRAFSQRGGALNTAIVGPRRRGASGKTPPSKPTDERPISDRYSRIEHAHRRKAVTSVGRARCLVVQVHGACHPLVLQGLFVLAPPRALLPVWLLPTASCASGPPFRSGQSLACVVQSPARIGREKLQCASGKS